MSPEEGKEVIIEYGKMKVENKKLERELSAALNGELSKYDELQTYGRELQSDLMESQKENETLSSIAEEAMDIAESENCEVQRLERENEEIKESHIKHITNMENYYKDRVQELKEKNGELQEVIEDKNSDLLFTEEENTQLKQDLLRTEELQDEIIQLEKDFENKHNLLSEFSQYIGNKPSSSTCKYFREKLDSIGIKEGE